MTKIELSAILGTVCADKVFGNLLDIPERNVIIDNEELILVKGDKYSAIIYK